MLAQNGALVKEGLTLQKTPASSQRLSFQSRCQVCPEKSSTSTRLTTPTKEDKVGSLARYEAGVFFTITSNRLQLTPLRVNGQ